MNPSCAAGTFLKYSLSRRIRQNKNKSNVPCQVILFPTYSLYKIERQVNPERFRSSYGITLSAHKLRDISIYFLVNLHNPPRHSSSNVSKFAPSPRRPESI